MELHLIIAECLGTDNEYSSEVNVAKSAQEAGEFASSLIADMCETMDVKGVDPTKQWSIEGECWWYRVRVEKINI